MLKKSKRVQTTIVDWLLPCFVSHRLSILTNNFPIWRSFQRSSYKYYLTKKLETWKIKQKTNPDPEANAVTNEE